MSKEREVAIEAVRSAGQAIVRHFQKGAVESKAGVSNVITKGDIGANRAIKEAIIKHFPGHSILSEESKEIFGRPEILDCLWVVDPLDGSKNYSNGIPEVWSSVAYVEKGEVICGASYNPFTDSLFFAERGKGAHYRGPSVPGEGDRITERLKVSECSDLGQASVETSISYNADQTINHELIKLALYAQGISSRFREIGSSVGQLCRVARGQSDLHFHSGLGPWDIATGMLLIDEAGGITRGMNGEEITIFSPHSVSGNRDLVEQFLAAVAKIKNDEEFASWLAARVGNFTI